MNVYSLPAKIRELVEPIIETSPAVSIARSRGSVGAESGEGYIVALADRIYLYSRTLGEYEYTQAELYYKGDIQLMEVQDERFSLILELTKGTGEKLAMKFAKYQQENLTPIVEQWQQATGLGVAAPARPVAVTADASGELSPHVAGVAALIFIAAEDGEIDPAEEYYILRFSGGGENASFRAAHDYYESHGYEELLALIGDLDGQQKMCILANAMDLAMADGVLHKSEQELIARLAETIGISEPQVTSMRDSLLVKNQISVLTG